VVPSSALHAWRGDSAARLDELFAAHRRVGGSAAGRRTDTQQINWALVLRLSAEFQGLARDLHTIGAETFAQWTAPHDSRLATVVENLLTQGLALDRGNPTPGNVGEAFNRFGLSWWPALQRRDLRTLERQVQLDRLNRARNAIAHSRPAELVPLRDEGYPLTLDTVRRWRQALNGLATTMDAELSQHLATFFAHPRPW
jgi:hypothetical protein